MVYTQHTSLQDSIASICKTILPFSFKKRRPPAIEQRLSKQQSDNLKWQQLSFHQILNLMGLSKEGIVTENQVSAFRTHLLETLIASPAEHEPPLVLRDKLIFLQELLYAKCISDEDYHSSKRPLLQRLAVQGAEIDARDVILQGDHKGTSKPDEWFVIDLKEEKPKNPTSKKNPKQSSAFAKMKGAAASGFGFIDKNKHLATTVSQGEEQEGSGKDLEKGSVRFIKKAWGFDGLKRWKKNESENETASSLFPDEKSSVRASYNGKLVANPVAEGPDTKQIKRKLNPDGGATDFFVDKVLGEKIKRELCRYPNVHLSDEQVEIISTRLPVDKEDLIKFFPKSWCDQYGDIVLDVVRKGFKEHMREMGHSRTSKGVERQHHTFDDENSHPNLLASHDRSNYAKQASFSSTDNIRTNAINSSIDKGFKYNPFFDM